MTNYCWYWPHENLVLPTRIRMSELPASAIRAFDKSRRFFTRIQPERAIRCVELNYCAGSPKIHKLRPRGTKHRRSMGGKYVEYYDRSSHKLAKTIAHRMARRKARIYFNSVDPDSDYNARLNPGLTEWEFS